MSKKDEQPLPLSFMTSARSTSRDPDAAMLVLASVSLRPTAFGRRLFGILEWGRSFEVNWVVDSEFGLSWTRRTSLPVL